MRSCAHIVGLAFVWDVLLFISKDIQLAIVEVDEQEKALDAVIAFNAKVFELRVVRVVRNLCLKEINQLLLIDKIEVVLEAVVDNPS